MCHLLFHSDDLQTISTNPRPQNFPRAEEEISFTKPYIICGSYYYSIIAHTSVGNIFPTIFDKSIAFPTQEKKYKQEPWLVECFPNAQKVALVKWEVTSRGLYVKGLGKCYRRARASKKQEGCSRDLPPEVQDKVRVQVSRYYYTSRISQLGHQVHQNCHHVAAIEKTGRTTLK